MQEEKIERLTKLGLLPVEKSSGGLIHSRSEVGVIDKPRRTQKRESSLEGRRVALSQKKKKKTSKWFYSSG